MSGCVLTVSVLSLTCTQDGPTLLRSHETLQEMHDLEVPPAASLAALAQPPSLSRFRCLERWARNWFAARRTLTSHTFASVVAAPIRIHKLCLLAADACGIKFTMSLHRLQRLTQHWSPVPHGASIL